MERLGQLREEVLALQDTTFATQRDLLQLQDSVLALRIDRSPAQSGAGVLSMDHFQDALIAKRSELVGERRNDFVILVDIDGTQHQHGSHQAFGSFGDRAQPPDGHGRDPEADGQTEAGFDSQRRVLLPALRHGCHQARGGRDPLW